MNDLRLCFMILAVVVAITVPIDIRIIHISANQAKFSKLNSTGKARIMDLQDELWEARSNDLLRLNDGQLFLIKRRGPDIFLQGGQDASERRFINDIGLEFTFLVRIDRVIPRGDLKYADAAAAYVNQTEAKHAR
jgi:hypothetical protein